MLLGRRDAGRHPIPSSVDCLLLRQTHEGIDNYLSTGARTGLGSVGREAGEKSKHRGRIWIVEVVNARTIIGGARRSAAYFDRVTAEGVNILPAEVACVRDDQPVRRLCSEVTYYWRTERTRRQVGFARSERIRLGRL
jgi:hypothetical protein